MWLLRWLYIQEISFTCTLFCSGRKRLLKFSVLTAFCCFIEMTPYQRRYCSWGEQQSEISLYSSYMTDAIWKFLPLLARHKERDVSTVTTLLEPSTIDFPPLFENRGHFKNNTANNLLSGLEFSKRCISEAQVWGAYAADLKQKTPQSHDKV